MLRKIRQMLKSQEGFTLVELMIVVVILGILAGIGIQQYGNVQRRARVAAHNANVRIIEGAARMKILAESDPKTEEAAVETALAGYLEPNFPAPEFGEAKEFKVTISEEDGDYTVVVEPGYVNEDGTLVDEPPTDPTPTDPTPTDPTDPTEPA